MSDKQDHKSNYDLNSRIALDAAIVMGILSFAMCLWKVPEFLEVAIAVCVGIAAALLTYAITIITVKAIRSLLNTEFDQYNDNQLTTSYEIGSINETVADLSVSIHSPSNYEANSSLHVQKPKITNALPKQWSDYLIDSIEWRVFDRLCIAYWRLKGNKISGIAERTTDGIDFFISSPTNKQARIAVIQTRSAQASSPTVEDVKNLLKLKNKNNLSMAILMYAGKLSNVVHSYCIAHQIHLLGSHDLAKGIKALPKENQQQLSRALIRSDYMVPSCPNCLIKLVKRQSVKSGRVFWGCISYPNCDFRIHNHKF